MSSTKGQEIGILVDAIIHVQKELKTNKTRNLENQKEKYIKQIKMGLAEIGII